MTESQAQTYFEDVTTGQEIPKVALTATSQQLVYWAAGSGDYYQIHYDKDFAQATGLPDRITHGALKNALVGRMLHEWAGEKGRVRRFSSQYRGMDHINKDVTSKGVITARKSENGANIVELEVWTEDPDGQKTTPGTAIVELPSKI